MREKKQPHQLLVKVLIDIHFLEDNLSILVKILVIPICPTYGYLQDCGIMKD